MIYRRFQDLELSALGFGAMRLPVIDNDDSMIDEPVAAEMVDYAMFIRRYLSHQPACSQPH